MAFVVVVCSKCRWARGAKAASKRIKCQHCGATIDVQKARPFAYADNAHDLSEAVGRANEELRKQGTAALLRMDTKQKPRPAFKGERESILQLARSKAEFTLTDAIEAIAEQRCVGIGAIDKESVVKAIEDLLMKGYLIESPLGRFRLV